MILLRGVNEKDPEGAEKLIKNIDPAGVYISNVFSSGDKAKEMYENILLWSK